MRLEADLQLGGVRPEDSRKGEDLSLTLRGPGLCVETNFEKGRGPDIAFLQAWPLCKHYIFDEIHQP